MTFEHGIKGPLPATFAFSLLRLGFVLVPSALLLAKLWALWALWAFGGRLATSYADILIGLSQGLGWFRKRSATSVHNCKPPRWRL